MGQDLLGAQSQPRRLLRGQSQGLIPGVRVQALGASEHGGEGLDGGPHDVVVDRLGSQAGTRGLDVESTHHGARIRGAKPLLHDGRPHASGDPELGHLLEQLAPGGEEERQSTGEVIDVEASLHRRLHVGDSIGQGEGELLRGGRSGLAHVVPGDGDRVPSGQLGGAELEDVGDQPHRRARRKDVGPPGDVLLEDVVLCGAADLHPRYPLGLRCRDVHGQQHGGRGIDGHAGADLAQRQAIQEDGHVGQAADRHAYPADLTLGGRCIGVVAHLGRQVERDGQAGLALGQEVAEPAVRLLSRREPGVLAHRPEPAPVHRGLDAAGERELAGAPKVAILPEVADVGGGVEVADLHAR